MLSESLSGISTIRANNAINHFEKKFRTVHDGHGKKHVRRRLAISWLCNDELIQHWPATSTLQADRSSPLLHAAVGLGFEWTR